MPSRDDSKKKKKKGSGGGGGKDFWDYVGEALVDSSPGKVFKENASADIEKKRLQNEYARDPNVIAAQANTLATGKDVYDKVHSSASSVGSGILGMFGVDAPSESQREINLLEAQTAAAAAASGASVIAPPAPPPEKDNTLLYAGIGLGAAVLVIGGALALSGKKAA